LTHNGNIEEAEERCRLDQLEVENIRLPVIGRIIEPCCGNRKHRVKRKALFEPGQEEIEGQCSSPAQ
jgi:hypothetical protein